MKIPDRFMVIDDDKTTTILCQHALRKFSNVTPLMTFMDPELALNAIREEYGVKDAYIPTVMFLDINMPVMTGWDFLEAFKDFSIEVRKQFTIYILSSSIDQRDETRSKLNPFVSGHISKPLKLESIKQIFNIVDNDSILSFRKIKTT